MGKKKNEAKAVKERVVENREQSQQRLRESEISNPMVVLPGICRQQSMNKQG